MTRAGRALATVLLLCLAAAGCGIPIDDGPRTIEGQGGAPASGEPARDGFGAAVVQLYLVREDRLVRVFRRVPAERTPQEQLDDLLAGPTPAERADGLTSALTATTVPRMTIGDRRAVVEIGDRGARSDDVLAFGQIVCTLTSRGPDIGTVSFTSGGEALGVPRADGEIVAGPLTIADYAALLDS